MPLLGQLFSKKNNSRLANQSGALLMAEGECLLLAQLGPGQHFSGFLTGGGVHIEVHEEDLGVTQLLIVTAFPRLGFQTKCRQELHEKGSGTQPPLPEIFIRWEDGTPSTTAKVGIICRIRNPPSGQ